jgi:hypothetical protein
MFVRDNLDGDFDELAEALHEDRYTVEDLDQHADFVLQHVCY